jgi:hypothetical protein
VRHDQAMSGISDVDTDASTDRRAQALVSAITQGMRTRARRYQDEAIVLIVLTIVIAASASVFFVLKATGGHSVNFTGNPAFRDTVMNFPEANWVDLVEDAVLRVGSVLLAIS